MSSSGIRAGRAFVEIGAVDKYSRVLAEAEGRFASFGAGLQTVGSKIGGSGLAIGAPFAAATAIFANFDDQMRKVGAVAGANASQLQTLTLTAELLGRKTSYTAGEVAALMVELGRGGFNPEQIDAMTASVLALARATGTDAARSAEIVTETVNQFGLKAGDAARVADVLTLAANRTNTSVDGLGESLKYAGPVAADLGLSLEDTVAILGSLGNAGVKGTEAGTALRRLGVLAAATGEDLKGIFGVDNVDAAGKLKPLVQVLDEIGAATAGMNVAERVSKFEEAFGLLGITAASVISRTGKETQQLTAALLASGGAAKTSAAEMDAGIGGFFRRVLSAAEGVSLAIGKQVEGPISAIAGAVTTVLGSVAEWIEQNKTAVVAAAALSAVLITAGASLLALGTAAKVAAFAVGGLRIAATVAFALAKAAYVAGVALVTLAGIARLVAFSFGALSAAARGVTVAVTASTALCRLAAASLVMLKASLFGAGAASAGFGVAMAALNVLQMAAPLATGLASAAFTMLGGVLTALTAPASLATALAGILSSAWAAAGTVIGTAWSVILAPLLPFIAAAAALIVVIGGIAAVLVVAASRAGLFAAMWNGVKATLGQLLAIVKATFGGIMTALQAGQYMNAAKILWAGIKAAFWTGVEAVTSALASMIANALPGVVKFGKALLSTLWDVFTSIPSLLMKALSGGKSLVSLITDALSGNLEGYLDVYGGVSKIADKSRKDLSDLVTQQDAAARSAKALADQQAELEGLNANKQSGLGPGASAADRAKYAGNAAQIDRLKEESLRAEKAAENSKAMAERIAELKDEAMALREGEAAAERFRLAQDGVTAAQLAAYDAATAAHKAAELDADVKERITALNEEAFALKHGEAAAERFKLAQMGATAAQLQALKAAELATDKAKEQAKLKDEGASLRESLRNPLEVFRDELAHAYKLKNAGAIDSDTLGRAKTKARDTLLDAADSPEKRKAIFAAEQDRLKQLVAAGKLNPEAAGRFLTSVSALLAEAAARGEAAGESMNKLTADGTFSGFAASRMSGMSKSDQLQTRIAEAAEANVHETRLTRQAIAKAGGGYGE